MSAESLQKVFKVLGDPTRVRILTLLEREELAVQELMEVLGMAQSRVSRHLGILREAGLLSDRRDGTFVLYRYDAPQDGPWADAWALSQRAVAEDPGTERDLAALARVVDGRTARSRSFFEEVGPEWEALRKVWGDDMLRAHALARLVPEGLTVVDVGTGTGALARELAAAGLNVIAVDHSETMLAAAREKLGAEDAARIDLRPGEAAALPLEDGEADAAFAHMVLQYLATPADALAEMVRVVRPGGRIVVVDFVQHDKEWMRHELGVVWLGFDPEEIRAQLAAAGCDEVRLERRPSAPKGADLPETFIVDGRRS